MSAHVRYLYQNPDVEMNFTRESNTTTPVSRALWKKYGNPKREGDVSDTFYGFVFLMAE